MTWPHAPEFRNGVKVCFWIATAAGVMGVFLPNVSIWERIFAIPIAYALVGPGFVTGWLVANFWRVTVGWLSMSFAYKLSLLYLYGGPVGAILSLILFPLQSAGAESQDPTLQETIALLPLTIGLALGVKNVLNKHYVVA